MSSLLGHFDWTDALLIGLFGFAIRATILLLAAWVATRLMRRASAATRHLVWTGAIAGVLALPLLGVLAPEWKVPVVWFTAKIDTPPEPSGSTSAVKDRESANVAGTMTGSTRAPDVPVARSERVATPTLSAAASSLWGHLTVQGVLATAWLMLAFLLLARLAIANARVSAWQRSSRGIEDERWLSLLRRLSRRYGIERPVILLESDETDVPVTWGIVYPVILVPAVADRWDEEQRIAVLTHELAHVKRFDALTQLFAQIALALLWFHPLVWMAVRRMRLEREHACDDFVLVAGARASRYADDLLALARRLTRPTAPAAAALAMARRSELEGRLLSILDPGTKRTAVHRARVGLLTLAVLLLAIPLAAFRPGARGAVESTWREPSNVAQPSTKPLATSKAVAQTPAEDSKAKVAESGGTNQLEALTHRLGVMQTTTLRGQSTIPALSRIPTDTEPLRPIDLETLIEVTKAAKPMTADHEKGLLLQMIARRYVRSDALRDAYLDAVSTMTSDHERSQALIALLDRDSLPVSSAAQVLRSAAMMTSDFNKGQVLKRISPAVFADSAVQRAYLDAIVAMTSDLERGAAIGTLVKQRPLTPAVQVALLKSTTPMTSDTEKANVLLLFLDKQGIADEAVKKAFFNAAKTLTSDSDYRRVMVAVMR